MTYEQALKKVQATKSKENYLIIKIDYAKRLVLPYKEGMAFIQSLANAELLNEPYNEQHCITEMDRSAIVVEVMSFDEYLRFKIAPLLGVHPKDIKQPQLMDT